MSIELDLFYSPYCPYCEGAGAIVEEAVRTLGLDGTVRHRNVLEHIDEAVAAGVRMTPAVTLGGRLIAAGRLDPVDLAQALAKAL